ncbi:MAG: glycosyltransferase family 2 protein [Bacteroidia bacterium]|nr:glycosyltransferase family 2 protein [Bacteroidia bacterium]
MLDISLVIPLLNEEESIQELVSWIERVMQEHQYSYEIIMIDDGSTDHSWKIISQLNAQNPQLKGIRFRRNYGKSAALNIGFAKAEGEYVITMDADLQDSPDEIPELYKMMKEEGYDLISGWKKVRYDNTFTKNLPSKLYNGVNRKISGLKLHDMNCGLKIYKNEVVKNIEVYGDMHRYIPVLAKNVGFKKIGEKVVQHRARKYGKTKFGIERFLNGFLDLLTLTFVGRFSKKPMHFFGVWGVLFFFLGFCASLGIGIHKLWVLYHGGQAPLVTSSPYFYLALLCMILGVQLFLAGFLGELISRESKDRNTYSVKEMLGISHNV